MGRNFNLDEYVTVHERVEKFHGKHPQGRITTSILEHDAEKGFILIRAEVFREQDDALPAATGHAYELRSSGYVQQGSYVEVCETSAVGRALALLGFEVKRGIASREEVEKTARTEPERAGRQAAAQAEEQPDKLDQEILQSAGELGYDAAKVKRWINQKYKVTEGLKGLPLTMKREVLKVFREQVSQAQTKET